MRTLMKTELIKRRKTGIRGFTILEVLIALTASLLLMLGLARAYKLLGDKVTEQQSELDLSSRLRDIAIRMRDELRRATCDMDPPSERDRAEGYLVYHEGPFTDKTSILGSVPHPTPRNVTYFPDSQFGDIDDFLAFTARSREGAPFAGFIPRGILDAVQYMNAPADLQSLITAPYAADPTYGSQLVPFYSDVAEVAYWLSPEWQRNANGTLVYEQEVADGAGEFSQYPVFRDRDGDLLPDRFNLHRRVLLIRPDLNVTTAQMAAFNGATIPSPTPGQWNVPTIPFLIYTGGSARIVPIADVFGANQGYFAGGTALNAPGLWLAPSTPAAQVTASPHWLTGLARMQQVMDLSVSRITDDWSAPVTGVTTPHPTFGMPTSMVQANSLARLARPENRFAHVRIPHQVISGTQGSSMPQLALCPPHFYLNARFSTPPDLPDPSDPLITNTPTTFPSQAQHISGTPPGATPYYNAFGRFTLKTFLRPEFNLADRVSDAAAGGGTLPVLVNRGGSDVIATDVVAFDVQIFDPDAPRFIWAGQDGQPGVAGFDDDRNNAIDDFDELGWPGSDDESVTVNDPRIDEVLVDNGNRTPANWNVDPTNPRRFIVTDRGDFVDLGYMRLPGGPMRGLSQFDQAGNLISQFLPAPTGVSRLAEFAGPISGLSLSPSVSVPSSPPPVTSSFPAAWETSGRFVLSTGSGSPTLSSFYQPVFDTWTDSYESDAFDQEGVAYGSTRGSNFAVEVGGVSTGTPAYTESRIPQNVPGNRVNNPRQVMTRRWSSFSGALSNEGQFAAQNSGEEQTVAQLSETAIRVTAPIRQPLRAIKVSIRLNDFPAETIRQQTVIQEF